MVFSIEIIYFSASANQCSNGKVLKESYSKKNFEEGIENMYFIESDTFPKNEKEYDKAFGRFKEREHDENYSILSFVH